jgi:NodT family efflux transporter outer membrane factor (OMF) lipoprotein
MNIHSLSSRVAKLTPASSTATRAASMHRAIRLPLIAALSASLAACAVGPDYSRPAFDFGSTYKEDATPQAGWRPAQPRSADPSQWWTIYNDSVLDGLMTRLNTSNQTIAQAEATYRQAQATLQNARAAYFPTVGASAGLTRSGGGRSGSRSSLDSIDGGSSSSGSNTSNDYSLSGSVSWEPDLWGKVRRTVEAGRAGAEASAGDLAAARLSAQSTLAQNYFELRITDEQKRLLDATVQAYDKSLTLTKNRYAAGVAGRADVVVAQTQLDNARAQEIDLAWQRGQFEHAIAALIGVPPSQFALPLVAFEVNVPEVPAGLPSQLLERRPDVSAAERRAAQANAQIGVAESAWFPDLTLSASGGFQSSQLAQWLTAPARFWSLGPALAATIFDGGARTAQVNAARAAYDAQAAAYRQSALDALREVEDYLIKLKVMNQEQSVRMAALKSARESVTLALNQYKQGLIDYLSVATLQTTALSTESTAITLVGDRLTTSVLLMAALGGGWNGDVVHPLAGTAEKGGGGYK